MDKHKKNTGIVLLSCILALQLPVSAQSPEELFRPKKPAATDTIFYPFYNDVQMIEIDHFARWDKEVYYMEQTQPRALSYSMLIPAPEPNVYLFRHRSGRIVKAFNTRQTPEILTRQFRNIPVNQKSKNVHAFFPYHAGKKALAEGAWIYSTTKGNWFNGLYKVYDMRGAGPVILSGGFSLPVNRVGLIDSLGNTRIPVEYGDIYPLKKYLLVRKDSGWGIIDRQQKVILPLEYAQFKYESENSICFLRKEKIAILYKIKEETIIPLNDYDDIPNIGDFEEHTIKAFLKDNKVGYLDKNFKTIVPAIYSTVGNYYPAYNELPSLVCRNDKWGYIDPSAKETIPCIYEYAEAFKADGTALVQLNGEFYCINAKGEKIAGCNRKPGYEKADIRSGGKNWVVKSMDVIGDCYGLVDKATGAVILSLSYRSVYQDHFRDLFRVKRNNKWGIAGEDGKFLLSCEYDDIDDLSRDMVVVKKDGRAGLLNSDFTTVIPLEYDKIEYAFPGHFIFKQNGKEGLIDTLRNIVIPNRYGSIRGFGQVEYLAGPNDFSQVETDSLYGFIDSGGREIIPQKYKWLDYAIYNGLVAFMEKGKYGFLDTTGAVVIPATYDRVSRFERTICAVAKKTKWGFINTKGEMVVPFIYDLIAAHTWMDGRYMIVIKDGKQGIVDSSGKLVISCKYDYITTFSTGYFYVRSGKKNLRVTESGEESAQ
ncbi:MAG TPA: WG repeat-containing protein [Chitinophagaceae bacterium]|jgi:hypothetical protein|nr:WG repeat-containing protein [Chitinophagaceae bacterium]